MGERFVPALSAKPDKFLPVLHMDGFRVNHVDAATLARLIYTSRLWRSGLL